MNSTHSTGRREETPVFESSSGRLAIYQQILIGSLCLALTIAAYKCVVQKSFLGDDHVHLVWLAEATKDPSLVLRNFWSNWLYPWTSPQCYRPLISVFMFTDYLVWHRNAVGFHITNLLFLALSSAALYGCVAEVLRWSPSSRLRLWPLLAAGTFALYPSHPESVSWVTGRVDAVVTAFYLCSVYAWMLWRRTSDWRFYFSSMLSMMLSLASKEMSVTIPVTLLCFELLRPANPSLPSAALDDASNPRAHPILTTFSRVRSSVFITSSAWVILAAYFILRKLALGTFVGGYDDTLAANGQLLLQHWSLGLNKVFVPINSFYADQNAWLISGWISLTGMIYSVSLLSLIKRGHRRQLLFFFTFALVSFVPVYKLFDGMPDLQGSRFSYLASAPIGALFAFGLAWLPSLVRIKNATIESVTQMAVIVIYYLAAAYMLWINNQPWMTASRWVSTLEKQFNETMANAKQADRFVYFNLPNNYRGAYLARNAVGDIGQHPHVDWKALESDDKRFELGQIREDIARRQHNFHCFFWSEKLGSFVPVTLPPQAVAATAQDWNAKSPTARFKIVQGMERAKFTSNGRIQFAKGNAPGMILVDLAPLMPWQVDFVQVTVSDLGKKNAAGAALPSLIVSSDLMQLRQLSPLDLRPADEAAAADHQVLYGLRLLPEWFCSSTSGSTVLLVPQNFAGTIGIKIPQSSTFLPRIERVSTAMYVTNETPLKYHLDVSKIRGATGCMVQLTKKNQVYVKQNSNDLDAATTAKTFKFDKPVVDTVMNTSDFDGSGLYQIRGWAVDSKGATVGLSSDYLSAVVL